MSQRPATDESATITTVIATRDRPELLRRALAAIEASTFGGTIETICVFDQCEPDLELVRTDGRRPVQVMANARTQGLAGGRNTGSLAATGDWLAFCDDDDEWLPSKIDAQMTALAARPDTRMATCGIAIRFEGDDHERIPDPDKLTFEGFLRDRMTEVHPSSFLMDRSWFLDEVGLVDEELPGSYAEDYDVLLRAAQAGPIASAPEALVRVHWHPSTYFRDRWTMIDDALGHLVEKFPAFEHEPKGLARIRGQQTFARAAAGDRRGALRLALDNLRRNPLEPRTPIALLVAAGVPPQRVLNLLHRFGRGI